MSAFARSHDHGKRGIGLANVLGYNRDFISGRAKAFLYGYEQSLGAQQLP
jgi:hypothetical protein